jgi:hypothetical protein
VPIIMLPGKQTVRTNNHGSGEAYIQLGEILRGAGRARQAVDEFQRLLLDVPQGGKATVLTILAQVQFLFSIPTCATYMNITFPYVCIIYSNTRAYIHTLSKTCVCT